MIAEAAAMGMAPSEFWSLSGPEIPLWLRGGQQRQDELYELGLLIAWHVAYWSRVKTLPSWDSIKKKMKPTPAPSATPIAPQSWQEQKGIMAAHRMALGAMTKPGKQTRGRKGRTRG